MDERQAVLGAYIIVPESSKDDVLRLGYRCTRRRRVPCCRNRETAIRTFGHYYKNTNYAVLTITAVPLGVDVEREQEHGYKLNTTFLPANCLAEWLPPSTRPLTTNNATIVARNSHPPLFSSRSVDASFFNAPTPTPRTTLPSSTTSPLDSARTLGGNRLPLRSIRYSQDSCSSLFTDGRPLSLMEGELRSGVKGLNNIPFIVVILYEGKYWSINNRRLNVFNRVFGGQTMIPVCFRNVSNYFLENQLTTDTEGRSIRLRR